MGRTLMDVITASAPSVNHIEAQTQNGEITKLNPIDNQWIEFAINQQQKQWEREDQIRKEIQEREDNAIQRWVNDARKAGINPNLYSGTGAESGGGITSATGMDTSIAKQEMQNEHEAKQKELDRAFEEIQKQLDREFNATQAQKDRTMDLIKSVVQTIIGTGGIVAGSLISKGILSGK